MVSLEGVPRNLPNENDIKNNDKVFQIPSIDEIKAYCEEKNNSIKVNAFLTTTKPSSASLSYISLAREWENKFSTPTLLAVTTFLIQGFFKAMRIGSVGFNPILFGGTTNVRIITDSHQETRRECAFLTMMAEEAKRNNNILTLNCGDLFKGVYSSDLEVQSWLKLKKMAPNIEIVMTLGNNDLGNNQKDLEYLAGALKKFDEKGIHVVCANIFENSSNKRPSWVKPYTTVERDNDKLLITGFCTENISKKTGLYTKDSTKILGELKQSILAEKPDGIIILNHDFLASSEELAKFAKEQGIKADLVAGGHVHDRVLKPNEDLRIYYPEGYCKSMYMLDLEIEKGISKLNNVKQIPNEGLHIADEFKEPLVEYETKTGLLEGIAPSVLHLPWEYSDPCPIGTFLADAMKRAAGTEIAFFSTGFLADGLPYKENSDILNCDLKRAMSKPANVHKVEMTPGELKKVFQNATESRMHKDVYNPRFLQCSQNVEIIGIGNTEDKTYKIKQIYIDKEPLLDENGEALKPNRKISCAIDAYISSGEQGYGIFKRPHIEENKAILKNNSDEEVKTDSVLLNALNTVSEKYPKGTEYPKFKLTDLSVCQSPVCI